MTYLQASLLPGLAALVPFSPRPILGAGGWLVLAGFEPGEGSETSYPNRSHDNVVTAVEAVAPDDVRILVRARRSRSRQEAVPEAQGGSAALRAGDHVVKYGEVIGR